MRLKVLQTKKRQVVHDFQPCCFSAGRVLLLTVTNACNQFCQHCMRDSRPRASMLLDMVLLHDALKEAKQALKFDRVVISGGEPTLVPNLRELISTVTGLSTSSTLCTNALLIDSAMAETLHAAGLCNVTVGFEGLHSEYDNFRRSRHGFERAMRGLRACMDVGIKTTVNVTLHDRIIDKVLSFAHEFGGLRLSAISVTSPIVQGRLFGHEHEYGELTYTRVMDFVKTLGQLVDCPIHLRIPRCDKSSCPSGVRVFSMNQLGELRHCPDVGVSNVLDVRRCSYSLPIIQEFRAGA